jgi:putative transposase
MQYHRKNRKKYLLLFHVIFVVKYRKSLLNHHVSKTLKESLTALSSKSEFTIVEMEVDNDHLHLMVDLEPTVSISQIVRRLKQQTTLSLWSNHNDILQQHFWNEKTFWSDGYFASSIGNANIDTVRNYIQNQG